jgi:rhodanese-related sulfurtransferase
MSDAVTPIEIDCLSVKQQLDAPVPFKFIDCREQDEYDRVKIAGAELLPMSQLAERVGELEAFKNSPLIIHCHHGGRSLRVARWLRGQGFVHAQSMAGGIDQWALQIDTSLPRY